MVRMSVKVGIQIRSRMLNPKIDGSFKFSSIFKKSITKRKINIDDQKGILILERKILILCAMYDKGSYKNSSRLWASYLPRYKKFEVGNKP